MPILVNSKGEKFEVPDNPTPTELREMQELGLRPPPSTSRDVTKSSISGLYEGVLRAPLIAGDLNKLALTAINKIRPGTIDEKDVDRWGSQGWVDAFRGSPQDKWLQEKLGLSMAHQPETTAGRYAKSTASSIGGAASMGGLGAAPGIAQATPSVLNAARVALTPSSMAINGATGAASELGYDISRGFDETKIGNPLWALAAGLGTGTGLNTFRQIMRPNLDQIMYNATRGVSPQQWDKSRADLKDFQKSGSQSFTLADLPELQPRVGGLARGLSNQTGGDLLQQKLSQQVRMNTDIPKLMREALEGTGAGPVDPREVTRLMAEKGNSVISRAEKARTTALLGNLDAAGNVDPADLLSSVNRNIRGPMLQPGNQSTGSRKALDAAEYALLGIKPPPVMLTAPNLNPAVTNVRSLSKNVKGLNDIHKSEATNAKGAIRDSDAALAHKAAEAALKEISPRYSTAMQQYQDTTVNLVNPLKDALPGAVRDAKSFDGVLSRLRQVPIDDLQKEIRTLGMADPEILQLAKAVGSNLKPVPNLAMAGDFHDRKIFEKLVDAVDPDLAKQLGNKISVSDALSRLGNEHSAATDVMLNLGRNPVSNIVSPFGSTDMRARLRTSAGETAKISELLGNPTPENLEKLRQLAKIDPRAKRSLEFLSNWAGAGAAAQTHNGE